MHDLHSVSSQTTWGRAAAIFLLVFLALGACNNKTPNPPSSVKACNGGSPCWLSKPGGAGSLNESQAYYTAIGAYSAKATFTDWLTANGFNPASNPTGDVRAIYFNAGDLDLGRDMNCKKVGNNIACYVSNYGPVPGQAGFPDPIQALAEAEAAYKNAPIKPPFATVAMESSPYRTESDHTVNESDSDVDSLITLLPGDRVIFDASGQIESGVALTGANGPEGWTNIDNDPKFPLPGTHPYMLLGNLDGAYFEIGVHAELTYQNQGSRLFLRINDDAPGNGRGAFQVHITVLRTNNVKFYVYDGQGKLVDGKITLDSDPTPRFTPHICIACHGGTYDPTYHGVLGASFLPFDVFSFEFSKTTGLTLTDQQEAFRQLNVLVTETGPNPLNEHNPIVELVNTMYPGGVNNPGSVPSDTAVPQGWILQPGVYQNFITPYCRMCHIAVTNPPLDFTIYKQFKGDTTLGGLANMPFQLRDRVCRQHTMPHAEVPFAKMWKVGLSHLVLDDPNVLPPPTDPGDKPCASP